MALPSGFATRLPIPGGISALLDPLRVPSSTPEAEAQPQRTKTIEELLVDVVAQLRMQNAILETLLLTSAGIQDGSISEVNFGANSNQAAFRAGSLPARITIQNTGGGAISFNLDQGALAAGVGFDLAVTASQTYVIPPNGVLHGLSAVGTTISIMTFSAPFDTIEYLRSQLKK